jgi:hypothetical protein
MFHFGVLVQASQRILFGFSYIPQNTIGPADPSTESVDLPGFNRAIVIPHQILMGAAWVPNRFFKIASAFSFVLIEVKKFKE